MNHLESSFTGKNSPWRYIVMFAVILIATNTVGAIPLLIGYVSKAASDPSIVSDIAKNPNDLGVLGLDPNMGLFMMLFPFLIGLLAFIILVKPLNYRTFKLTVNGTSTFRWNRFLVSGMVWAILSALYFFIYLKIDPSNFSLKNVSETLIPLILISLIFIPFQAAFEEVLFRGYLMQGFTVLFRNRWFPLLITSVLFGLMHAFNPEVEEFGFFTMMPQYVFFGLIFGIVTILDDGIEAAIGAHAANNAFLCIMVTHDSSALQTPAVFEQQNIYPFTELAALLVTGLVFVVIMKMIFRWGSYSLVLSNVEAKPVPGQSPYTDVLSSVR
jgi:membrane protease YdiL (CAAX protease family)